MTDKTELILGGAALVVGGVTLTAIVKQINQNGGNISQGIHDGIVNVGDAVAKDIKYIGIGGGIGVLGFLLLPPPLDLLAVVAGAATAVVLYETDKNNPKDDSATVTKNVTVYDSNGYDQNGNYNAAYDSTVTTSENLTPTTTNN